MTIRSLATCEQRFVTVAELADYLGLSTRVIYSEIATGALRARRCGPGGRNIRIPIEEAQRYAGEDRQQQPDAVGRA